MAEKPEERARAEIDRLLAAAGWSVQSMSETNIHAARGVALREFPLKSGHGFADYLLYIDAQAAGVIEAKKEGVTLTGVESQSDRYAQGLPEALPAWSRPLPFSYQSTGVETHFTNGLDPEPRARPTFAFHRPEMLATWLSGIPLAPGGGEGRGEGLLHSRTTQMARNDPRPHRRQLWNRSGRLRAFAVRAGGRYRESASVVRGGVAEGA